MEREGVMATNDDASNSKRFAVSKGYWLDEFIQHFVKILPERKAPEINRGYFIRHYCIQRVIDQFLETTECECQIVTIGAGFDTLFWNLCKRDLIPKYGLYELDLKPVVDKKIMYIQTRQPLSRLVDDFRIENSIMHGKYYHLAACDITNVAEVEKVLTECSINKDMPTLFLSECVFVYLHQSSVENLLKYIQRDFKSALVVDYDPVNLNDTFGEIMKQNLRGRKCHLLGAHPNVQSKMEGYNMFQCVKTKLLIDLYNELDTVEKARIEKIEFLDEVHLLYDLLKHYCLSIASNNPKIFDFISV